MTNKPLTLKELAEKFNLAWNRAMKREEFRQAIIKYPGIAVDFGDIVDIVSALAEKQDSQMKDVKSILEETMKSYEKIPPEQVIRELEVLIRGIHQAIDATAQETVKGE
jgi:hypothetical protein